MRILILGGDGYLGWPTALRFSAEGDEVAVVDNFNRRRWVEGAGSDSLTPIADLETRIAAWEEISGKRIPSHIGPIEDGDFLDGVVADFLPDAVVHYGQQASAPYSMISRQTAVETQYANTIGNLNLLFAMRDHVPEAHLVKLGTMGEYGQPNIDIEEGYIEISHKGRSDTLPFPKLPGSLYHCSKVHDSTNIHFACRTWGLRATDLNQGVVYGIETEETVERRAADHALRLRRALRHGPEPLLSASRDRSSADRLRRRQPDAQLPQHPGHARLRRDRRRQTPPRPASSASSTSSPSSSR